MDGASRSRFHPQPPVVGHGDGSPVGRGRLAQLKVELGFSAAEPSPAYAEINAEVEDGYGDER